MLIVSALYTSV